jgi:hypothetical protein
MKKERPPIYGLMAEFKGPDELIAASQQTYDAGYRVVNAYAPFPVEGLAHAIGYRRVVLPWLVLAGGLLGGIGGYLMEFWTSAVDYPINVGGRPYNSIPYFIPVMFEMTILGAALTAVFGMLALNKLPMPYHPVFNVPRFELASQNRFFLCIESRDPQFDQQKTMDFIEALGADEVTVVEH